MFRCPGVVSGSLRLFKISLGRCPEIALSEEIVSGKNDSSVGPSTSHGCSFQPSGDYQLTRAYLQQLTTDELIDYVMSLMMELKQIKSQVQQIEAERNDLGEQLMSVQQMAETCEQEKEELILVQQRLAVFDPDQMDQDMIDLRNLLLALKEKADRYDCLEKENKCLKLKLDEFCGENTIKRNASFDEGACGDSVPLACEKLKAELRHYKQSYGEMKVQKRALMEQLQLTKLRECRYWEMKNRLAEEECKRACLQTRIDDLLVSKVTRYDSFNVILTHEYL